MENSNAAKVLENISVPQKPDPKKVEPAPFPKNFAKSVGLSIKFRRKVLKISASELAEKVGVSANFIYQIESGRKLPSLINLKMIYECLDITHLEFPKE